MRNKINTSLLLFALIMLGCNSNEDTTSKEPATSEEKVLKKPNIVYVLTDQWRAQATGYNGDPNLVGRTPNLDKIASEGVNFKNAISTTPVCTPYRSALLTGQYPSTTGMFLNDLHLPEESYCMAEMFKEGGYNTAYIGKWHLDGLGRAEYTPKDRRQGFDYWKALECSHDYKNLYYYAGDDTTRKVWEGYGPYAETQDAIAYMKDHANDENPFLLVLAVGAPHFPYRSTPDEFQPIFKEEGIILPDNITDEKHRAKATKDATGYYAHIMGLDSCIGNLQRAIEDAGIAENTIFVFTSDHGEMLGSHGWKSWQKQVSWAEAVRIPFLLKYPAKYGKEGIEVDAPIGTPDVLPTLLNLAGLEIPKSIEGESMNYAIGDNEAAKDKAALVLQLAPFAGDFPEYRGVYTNRYAYITNLDGPVRMFDNIKDPLQMNNLLDNPEFAQVQADLEQKLQAELAKIGDEFKPKEYYLDKWNYTTREGGAIPYSQEANPEIVFQGPSLNKKFK